MRRYDVCFFFNTLCIIGLTLGFSSLLWDIFVSVVYRVLLVITLFLIFGYLQQNCFSYVINTIVEGIADKLARKKKKKEDKEKDKDKDG